MLSSTMTIMAKMAAPQLTWSISAFCHTRNNMRNVLSRAPNDVKKNFSWLVVIAIALGMTRAVFSLVIAVISLHFNVNYKEIRYKCSNPPHDYILRCTFAVHLFCWQMCYKFWISWPPAACFCQHFNSEPWKHVLDSHVLSDAIASLCIIIINLVKKVILWVNWTKVAPRMLKS